MQKYNDNDLEIECICECCCLEQSKFLCILTHEKVHLHVHLCEPCSTAYTDFEDTVVTSIRKHYVV